jgi:thiol:disulfide interchange protein DsbD
MKLKSLLAAITAFLLLCSPGVQSQIFKPVKWSFSSEKDGKNVVLLLKATMEPTWHLYAQNIPAGGPIPTTFKYTPAPEYSLVGKTIEPEAEEVFDPNFEMQLRYFGGEVVFRQKIKTATDKAFSVKGTLEFMACNDERCIPPEEVEFEIPVSGVKSSVKESAPVKTENKDTVAILPVVNPDTIKNEVITPTQPVRRGSIPDPDSRTENLEPGCNLTGGEAPVDQSLIGIFIAGMLGGFLALLTPCVFPMIPLTVSFFTKRSKTRQKGIINAAIYAVSIILIYVTLGFLVTVTLGSDALNAMASNVFFNLLFFVIFFIFALSFFGAFEITLPASWINKADTAADKGGLLGIFFMAFTLSLVSFSCTGPIIGTLLVEAAHGRSYLGPIAGMTGFSVALALPFALFAAFPGWLNSLPKSGGWLNSVKVTLGFLELALALKFLSNVDLAYHWGILKRELFIALWVVIFGLMGLYLLGKLKFSHDSDSPHISTGRLIFGIIALTFTLYLVPGLFGAPLKMISGFPPPEFYKEWVQAGEHSGGECPHNLNCYHDYEAGMAYAKSVGKPVMIDFTGWSCVNCRKMEDNVWSQPKILKHISDDYVLISLYVDDKTQLDSSEQYLSKFSGKKIKTTGNKWSEMQSRVFNTNSQPYYVLLDHEGKLLAEPRGYTPDAELYGKFLEEGLCRFELRR